MSTVRSWCATPAVLFICLAHCLSGRVNGEEPTPGDPLEISFIGEDGEECEIPFRWCPSGVMKGGDPDALSGMPMGQVEGFWLSETEVSQEHYRIIAGTDAMEKVKGYVLDKFPLPVEGKPRDELTEIERTRIEEREKIERANFGDSGLPVYGLPPRDADEFCSRLSDAYERFRSETGRRAVFSTRKFRLPAHYEWQYACRAESQKKHFAEWPDDPLRVAVGGFENYREYLEKKDPDLYQAHKGFFDSFDGSESSIVKLLGDPHATNDRKVRRYLEELVVSFLPVATSLRPVAEEMANAWKIRGLASNVSEWVVVIDEPTADSSNMPTPGDFASGSVLASYAGGYSMPSGNIPWKSLSIWHWQANTYTDTEKDRKRVSGQPTGIRIAMIDAVSDTWFAELRRMAGRAYDGAVSADALHDGFESGMEVVGRDKEGRKIATARVRIYGALAKARAGKLAESGRMLHEGVNGLKEAGDEFFAQLEPLLAEDDLHN